MNELFDELDSKSLRSINPWKCPLKRIDIRTSNCEDDDDLNLDWDLSPKDHHFEYWEIGFQPEQIIREDINISNGAEIQVHRLWYLPKSQEIFAGVPQGILYII
ncbi:unnamed protein product [Ceratitis capitata]|uniref:(Mediterranean fruit fly) hypothetical protein n=1 Tax=Ceratitis capitata TaxID=7213 RepID=A0A811UHW7_CERCA|nr:unnamed protein product [Ceratitis capitata]